jgi:heterodisulfide reductase subunit A
MSNQESIDRANSVLIVGGGIAGIKASLDLAETGRKVYVVDKSPALGGYLPLLDRQFPTNDCQICYLAPELAKSGHSLDIEVLPLTKVTGLIGNPGDFKVSVKTEPRYIDLDRCTACGECLKAAPEGAVTFTPGLDHRAPTCMRYPQAVPMAYSINKENLTDDNSWTEVCEQDAIDLNMQPEDKILEVGAVIVATGAELFDPISLQGILGYGRNPDVVTSLEFERILSASGPTGGVFSRPSDGKKPKKIGWIQCVGSRTTKEPGKPYCSSICCMFAMKEAVWALEHFADDLDATIFYMDMRPMGKDYEQYYQRVKNENGVNFVRCRPHTVFRDEKTGESVLSYMDEEGKAQEARLDMVVLATGFHAPCDAKELADNLGVELDPYNFMAAHDFSPVSTSRPGVYACGMALGPRDIPDSVIQGSAAACQAAKHLSPAPGLVPDEEMPPERDVTNEEPKVGVFICDFGASVKHVVDFKALAEYMEKSPEVAHVEEIELLWTSAGLERMTESIKEHGINRVVVAGYSPRSHLTLFADSVRKAGLNKAYLDMANIREQAAWVHQNNPAAATTKAIDLVRMSVAGVRAARPIFTHFQPVEQTALVVGGGVSGMAAALSLAEQGTKVYLVEKSKELGGLARKLARSLDGGPVPPQVEEMVGKVEASDKIELIKEALIVDHQGEMGAFKTSIQSGPAMYYQEINHGVTVIATGASEYKPTEYLYGQDQRVLTQLELEKRLSDGETDDLNTVVMIQCVGSRNENNPACGRVCCRSAVKNALWLKEQKPDARLVVLYRDMRMPYTAEESYRAAREKGVLFVRYNPEDMPQVRQDDGDLKLRFTDPVLGRPIELATDALVLSVPQVAVDEETEELASIFRLQRSETGFLMEQHAKYLPVDSPIPGLFLAGSALAPKSLNEAVTQGQAAAGRALAILAQERQAVEGGVAKVMIERCAACLVCVRACPFDVPFINADGFSEIDPAKCQGCGICASVCPAKAIYLQGYQDEQIMDRTDALLEGVL